MKWIMWAGGLLAFVGTITTGWVFFDDRYAKAGYVEQQIDGVKQLYLKSERREIQRQRFEIENARQQRKLTDLELQRAAQLDQDTRDVENQILLLEQKKLRK